eukprot:12186530-Heterocapsa_arctica.AAC.1
MCWDAGGRRVASLGAHAARDERRFQPLSFGAAGVVVAEVGVEVEVGVMAVALLVEVAAAAAAPGSAR